MAKSIYDYLRSRPYFGMAWDKLAIKKIALDWAMDTNGDIAEALSSDTVDQVLRLLAEDHA